jgi:hypothetical protein
MHAGGSMGSTHSTIIAGQVQVGVGQGKAWTYPAQCLKMAAH